MPIQIRPDHKAINAYYHTLDSLKAGQQITHEGGLRRAFGELLSTTARARGWTLVEELSDKHKRTAIRLDGTLRDEWHLPHGFWEAKDTSDDLDTEIQRKRARGYPFTNIIFEDTETAVLFQDGQELLRTAVRDRAQLARLLTYFFNHEIEPFEKFDEAIAHFQKEIPNIAHRLKEKIDEAHRDNKAFQTAFAGFMELCRTALNPNISPAAVDEMLIQHMLTERLIRKVFNFEEFTRRNVIASEVENVIDKLTGRYFNRAEFLGALDRFYTAIENAAEKLATFTDKQRFINTVYEKFFQGYSVAIADTHGIVYTPQEIVDFMCAAVEEVLANEFGKKLGDDGVFVIDPCTGTGSFVVNLLRRAYSSSPKHFERFYREQLFANEVMLMPYYIASLNIEHEYYDLTGHYQPFEGVCFVDTLDLAEGAQMKFSFVTEANTARVERQKQAPITVIIGNPPYNVGQLNENDNNKNRKYEVVDKRVSDTYARDSRASNKNALSDPYVKFFRWATDRLQGRDGIVCYVSNNSFVDQFAFDGMRQHLLADFTSIYHLDLHGNVRQNPKLSGTTHNVFGIQVGVGITVAVRVSPPFPPHRNGEGLREGSHRHDDGLSEGSHRHDDGLSEGSHRHDEGLREESHRHDEGLREESHRNGEGLREGSHRHDDGLREGSHRHDDGLSEESHRHDEGLREESHRHDEGLREESHRHDDGLREGSHRHDEGQKRGVYYHRVPEFWRKEDKLKFLTDNVDWEGKHNSLNTVQWQPLVPDARNTWLVPENADEFETFMSIGSKETKSTKTRDVEAIFRTFSNGVKTNRDTIVYDFDRSQLVPRVKQLIEDYNAEVDRYNRAGRPRDVDNFVNYRRIKWSEGLKANLQRGNYLEYDEQKIRGSLYRPFCKQFLFFDSVLNERRYVFPGIFPTPQTENKVICLSGVGHDSGFRCLISESIVELKFSNSANGGTQCFPFYVYDENGGSRRENITDWALAQFRAHYLPTPDSPPHRNGEGLGEGTGWAHTHAADPNRYKAIKPLARQMRSEQTAAEKHLWQRIRHKQVGGYKFRRQHVVDRFVVDFYCAEARLVIEVDGPTHEYTQEEDALRTAFLESLGLRVLRFTNGDVLQATDAVVERIGEVLQENPHPNPSPAQWASSEGGEQQPREITKWDIFYYIYGLLHHPGYRARYADNLKRELPRIPLAPAVPGGDEASGFWAFSHAGKKLADLHLNYENMKGYNLTWETKGQQNFRVEKMRLNKDKTALKVNDYLTLTNIPPQAFNYRLGNRSALEWVIDQYQIKTDSRSGITSDPNGYSDDPRYIVDLVEKVVQVSIETVQIVNELAALDFQG